MIHYPPFQIGDKVEFVRDDHGVRNVKSIKVIKVGIDKADARGKDAWRVRIAVNGKPRNRSEHWSAGWFRKVKS